MGMHRITSHLSPVRVLPRANSVPVHYHFFPQMYATPVIPSSLPLAAAYSRLILTASDDSVDHPETSFELTGAEMDYLLQHIPAPTKEMNIFSEERSLNSVKITPKRYRNLILHNPHGMEPKKSTFSWIPWCTFRGGEVSPLQAPIKGAVPFQYQSGGKSPPASTKPCVQAHWIISSGIMGFSMGALVQGAMDFLHFALKRWFPHHHPQIDRLMTALSRVLVVGGVLTSVLTMIMAPGTIPVVIISGLAGFVGAFIFKYFGVGTKAAQFVFHMKDVLFHFFSSVLKKTDAPPGTAEELWKQHTSTHQLQMGLCMHCNKQPRSTISGQCLHTAYCHSCAIQKSHCPCGKEMDRDVQALVETVISCEDGCCLVVPPCEDCDSIASVLQVNELGGTSYRCKRHEDTSKQMTFRFPFKMSRCDRVPIPTEQDGTPE